MIAREPVLGVKLYRLNDYEIWKARSPDEAKAGALRAWGYPSWEAAVEEGACFDEPEEIADEFMDTALVLQTDEDERPLLDASGNEVTRTYREELRVQMEEQPNDVPGFFAGGD